MHIINMHRHIHTKNIHILIMGRHEYVVTDENQMPTKDDGYWNIGEIRSWMKQGWNRLIWL